MQFNCLLKFAFGLTLSGLAISSPARSWIDTSTDLSSSLHKSDLEKRMHWGYIGTYDTDDCSGPWNPYHPRPEVRKNGACVPYVPQAGNIGVNFGTGTYRFHQVTLYNDTACSGDSIVMTITEPKRGGNACFITGSEIAIAAFMENTPQEGGVT